ncbi:MAG: hypothetical protein IAE94_05750 [Chthoniobacterales bacterium]|nr:hypothetical protein [Chthoniobacterales bacterium]
MKIFAAWVCALACVLVAICEEPKVLEATDLDQLKAHVGQEVVVEGLVTEIGATPTKSIAFINLGFPKKQGFAAVIFKKNHGAFPEGFDLYKTQKLRVSGVLTLYQNERLQIEVSSPAQIEIVKPE